MSSKFEVQVAEDREKGCEIAAAERPDGPGDAGRRKRHGAWRTSQTRDMPVIGLSAHALAGEREKALAAGCEEFDTKPVEFDRLLGQIR